MTDGRVNGSLNLSRALGDMEYKQSADLGAAEQIVTAVPEVGLLTHHSQIAMNLLPNKQSADLKRPPDLLLRLCQR